MAVGSNPDSLDPRFANDSLGSKIAELTCPGLTGRDVDGNLIPELAERWRWESPTLLVFTLRPGLFFHDGSPVESEDVAETYRSILDPATGSLYAAPHAQIDSIEARSPLEVAFHLKTPWAPTLQNLVNPGVMKRGLPHEPVALPVCAGPYRPAGFERDAEVRLEAFDRYWRGPPKTAKLVFRIVPDATIRTLELSHGSVDLLQNAFPPYLEPVLARQPHVRLSQRDGRNLKYLVYNLSVPALADVRVRRAIAKAIDRDSLIHYKLQGTARPASGIIAPDDPFSTAVDADIGYDPAAAARLLDEAGLAPGPDGVRLKLQYKTSLDEGAIAAAKLIKLDLAQVGVKVTIATEEWGTFFQDVQRGNFEIYTLTSSPIFDPDFYRWMLASSNIPPAGSASNRGGYRNDELDRLVTEGGATIDPEARKKIYDRIAAIVARDLPVVPLWHEAVVVGASDRVEGYRASPFASFVGLAQARKR